VKGDEMTTVTVYELRYSMNGCAAESGPSIATLWVKPKKIPSDCVVVAVDVDEDIAFEIAE
jgi:hypothetical protein